MQYRDLTDEQRAKVRSCESPEEMLALAQEEGLELTDEQLDGIAGGWSGGCSDYDCYMTDV